MSDMLRANFKDDPMAHLIAPRQAFNKAASGAAIEVYRRPARWQDRVLRLAALIFGLAAIGLVMGAR